MICRYCRWSIWNGETLWCDLFKRPAKVRCGGFEREPGADDDMESK